jgi:hypothetical protein
LAGVIRIQLRIGLRWSQLLKGMHNKAQFKGWCRTKLLEGLAQGSEAGIQGNYYLSTNSMIILIAIIVKFWL